MAGRILREEVRKEIIFNSQIEDPVVIISGLSNIYTHYITTEEEYDAQVISLVCQLFCGTFFLGFCYSEIILNVSAEKSQFEWGKM
jgi:hypothetical protein